MADVMHSTTSRTFPLSVTSRDKGITRRLVVCVTRSTPSDVKQPANTRNPRLSSFWNEKDETVLTWHVKYRDLGSCCSTESVASKFQRCRHVKYRDWSLVVRQKALVPNSNGVHLTDMLNIGTGVLDVRQKALVPNSNGVDYTDMLNIGTGVLVVRQKQLVPNSNGLVLTC